MSREGNPSDAAKDIAQRVFADVARRAGELSPRPVHAGWLYLAARNQAVSFVRRERRRAAREQKAYSMGFLSNDDRVLITMTEYGASVAGTPRRIISQTNNKSSAPYRVEITSVSLGSSRAQRGDGYDQFLLQLSNHRHKFPLGKNLSGNAGGLLMIQDTSTGSSYLPAFDGHGNMGALLNAASPASSAIVATYEYSPFGEILQESGSYASSNPIRWGSQWMDEETRLVYYGLRYYKPSVGRFISQDPAGTAGGLNSYAFCGNDGVNKWDTLGMAPNGATTGLSTGQINQLVNGTLRFPRPATATPAYYVPGNSAEQRC